MDRFDFSTHSHLNSRSDNMIFKDAAEKNELLPEIRDLKMDINIRLGLWLLAGMGLFAVGSILYMLIKG